MKRALLRALAALAFTASVLPASAQDLCSALNGATLIAQDDSNTFLGKIASSYSSDSIFNEYGTYGSEYSSKSIWNTYGTFGSEYSGVSPHNSYSTTPPMIIKDRKVIGFLSVNKSMKGSVSPNLLKAMCKDEM